jgi:isoleucyl-tRNA synthetase
VNPEIGTGVVHIVPSLSEVDYNIFEENGIEIDNERKIFIDENGRFGCDFPIEHLIGKNLNEGCTYVKNYLGLLFL